MGKLKEKMIFKMELKNFSKRTKVIYLYHMEKFVRHYGKSPEFLGRDEVEAYLHSLFEKNKSSSGIIQSYSALKFFYAEVLGKGDVVGKIIRPICEKKLPVVLSLNEVKHILDNVKTVRSRVMFMVTYSGGLRLGEVLNLKVNDIDSERMLIRVEQGKGKKDRYTLLSRAALNELRKYYREHKPKDYMFTGKNGKPLDGSTLQRAFKEAKKKRESISRQPYIRFGIVLQPIF